MADRATSDAAILAQIPAARARERREHRAGLRAMSARYDRKARRIVLELTNDMLFAFPVAAIPALGRATEAQLADVSLDAAGGAVRWDALDVDLSVPGLILSAVEPSERLRHLAGMAGRVRSRAKARAARANGRKGGRPRKPVREAYRRSRS
jgi:hypothetical protein